MAKNNRYGQSAILTSVDEMKIRRHLKKESHRLLWDVARFTGERWGAIVQLRIEDVFSSRGEVRECITFRSATRKASPTGERATRQVPVHPSLREILQAFTPAPGKVWMFPNSDGEGHLSFSAAEKALRAAILRAGLDGKGISTHSTRRTFITRLSELGVDVRTLQQLTGHQDVKTLLRYVEVSPDRVRRAISLL